MTKSSSRGLDKYVPCEELLSFPLLFEKLKREKGFPPCYILQILGICCFVYIIAEIVANTTFFLILISGFFTDLAYKCIRDIFSAGDIIWVVIIIE